MRYEICVIGNKALLFPFLQFGFTTYSPVSEDDLREYLAGIISMNYGIVYIEDSYCFMVKDIIDLYCHSLRPIFIPIGDNPDRESFSALAGIEMMERAIGMNVI
jgi:vacuolar-type H+-ATPase subunit F/Vma7